MQLSFKNQYMTLLVIFCLTNSSMIFSQKTSCQSREKVVEADQVSLPRLNKEQIFPKSEEFEVFLKSLSNRKYVVAAGLTAFTVFYCLYKNEVNNFVIGKRKSFNEGTIYAGKTATNIPINLWNWTLGTLLPGNWQIAKYAHKSEFLNKGQSPNNSFSKDYKNFIEGKSPDQINEDLFNMARINQKPYLLALAGTVFSIEGFIAGTVNNFIWGKIREAIFWMSEEEQQKIVNQLRHETNFPAIRKDVENKKERLKGRVSPSVVKYTRNNMYLWSERAILDAQKLIACMYSLIQHNKLALFGEIQVDAMIDWTNEFAEAAELDFKEFADATTDAKRLAAMRSVVNRLSSFVNLVIHEASNFQELIDSLDEIDEDDEEVVDEDTQDQEQ